MRLDLRAVMERLSKTERKICRRLVEEASREEIAAELGMSLRSIGRHLQAVRVVFAEAGMGAYLGLSDREALEGRRKKRPPRPARSETQAPGVGAEDGVERRGVDGAG